MKLTLTTKEKILLAKYWIFKLEDLYGDNLKDYDEYKLYYLPLKSYHLNKTASDINDDLRRRYEILYKIPQKYYDIDYTEIRDKKFPKLFRVAKLTQKIKKDSKIEPIKKISYYDLYETDINKYKKDSRYKVRTYGRIWDATRFADEYIRIKKYLKKYKKSIDYSWLKEKFIDMNKFLNEITPKPISKYIEDLLQQIDKDNLDIVNIEKKQGNTKSAGDGMYNKYGYSYYDWKNLTKQRQVEILADMARKDTVNTQNQWWNNFKAEFPEGYSTELGRYRDKFKIKNRHQQFKINGLIFYKGKE